MQEEENEGKKIRFVDEHGREQYVEEHKAKQFQDWNRDYWPEEKHELSSLNAIKSPVMNKTLTPIDEEKAKEDFINQLLDMNDIKEVEKLKKKRKKNWELAAIEDRIKDLTPKSEEVANG